MRQLQVKNDFPTKRNGKIFCLETEWSSEEDNIQDKSPVKSLLEFMENTKSMNMCTCFRQVACYWDFKYYLEHLKTEAFQNYNIVYLCFHGSPGKIALADGKHVSLIGLGRDYPAIFKGRYVHFDSCSTLECSTEAIRDFKKITGARVVSGFTKTVEFNASFIFELWLFSVLSTKPDLTAKK